MQRPRFNSELHEGTEAEYEMRHDESLPHPVSAIKDAGFSNYSPFRRGTLVIACAEIGPDLDATMAKLGAADHNAR